jgi:hypothetical protein
MVIVKLFIISGCITSYILIVNDHNHLENHATEIIYNNLIAGEVTKQLSLVRSIKQMQSGQYSQSYSNFANIYKDNIVFLDKIRGFGGPQYNVSVHLGVTNVNFLNTEFILSLIDNAKLIQAKIEAATSQSQFVQSLQIPQFAAMGYLENNCLSTKDAMVKQSAAL